MRAKWALFSLMVLCLSVGLACVEAGEGLKPMTAEAALEWKSIREASLTRDGRWLVYQTVPAGEVPAESVHDVVEVIAREVQGEREYRYRAGAASKGAGGVAVSSSGRWAGFRQVDADGVQVVLIELESGQTRSIRADQFAFNADTPALPPGADEARASPEHHDWLVTQSGTGAESVLTLRPLGPGVGAEHNLTGVHSFEFDASGGRLAVASVRGLEVYALSGSSGRGRALADADGGQFSDLSWSSDGRALASIYTQQGRSQILAIRDVSHGRPQVLRQHPLVEGREGRDDGSITGPLHWRDENDGVYFQVSAVQGSPQSATPFPSSSPSGAPTIWRGGDALIPAQQRAMAGVPRVRWQYLNTKTNEVLWLTAEGEELVMPQGRGAHALVRSNAAYGWMDRGAQSRATPWDYTLVSLDTGARRSLVEGLKVPFNTLWMWPRLSPDGELFVYQERSDYRVLELASGARRNLTAGLPAKFALPGNDGSGYTPDDGGSLTGGDRFQGWSTDGDYVLVSNHWDVWALPLREGKRAFRLTEHGEREEVSYLRADVGLMGVPVIPLQQGQALRPVHWVDLNQPIYFATTNLQTGEHGLARWTRQGGTQLLNQAHARLAYRKAADANVWVAWRMTFAEPMDYYRVADNFKLGQALTDANPQQRRYQRPTVQRYLRYTNEHGEVRRAVLSLPAGYEPGKRYPTVVRIYKGMSGNMHVFHGPLGNPWLYEGYAVLMPDITISRMNDAGEIARADVMAGVDAAIETGMVDGDRLGLSGFSYGAYQTLYIISQTDRFKVAEADAGISDVISWCAGLYSGARPGMELCESNQPYLSGPWWDHWNTYVNNSPLFHVKNIRTPLLLVHGTADKAVPFEHSVGMFNALRRLRQSPVALLEYEGMGHGLSGEAEKDRQYRRLELFDHYLNSRPMPKWWDRMYSE